jgi:hypothetical protein
VLGNEYGAVPLDNFSSLQREDPRVIRPVATSKSSAVPWVYQAPLSVDRSLGKIGTEVPTAPADGKPFAVRISYRVPPGTADHRRNWKRRLPR